ncbi:MAG: PAS domain S-box protein [Ignavibacteriaceae bacterium]
MKKKSSEMSTPPSKKKKKEKKIPLEVQTSLAGNKLFGQIEPVREIPEQNELLESLEDAISANLITTPSGKLVYCNKAFLSLFGFKTKEEAIRYPLEKLYLSADDRTRFLESLKKNKKLENFETMHVSVDGRIIHTLENMLSVFNEAGELVKIYGSIIDITAHKIAEEALRDSENSYRELIELAVEGILIGSHDGIILGANSYMQKLTGRPLEDLIGMHVSGLFREDELSKIPLRFDLLMKGETVVTERNLIRPDGAIIPIEMHTKMMPNGTYQSIYHDITERKATEKALRESEEKYRKTFYTSPDAIAITRLDDGKFVSINAGFTKILDYTEDEVIGQSTLGLNIWADPDVRRKLSDGLKRDGVVDNLETRFRKKNGEICIGLMSASRIEIGGIPHLISVSRDITERKEAEENIKKINRLYVVLSNINQAIVRIKEQEELFNEACRIAVDDGKFVMAWIGLVNQSTNKVDVISKSGVTKDYFNKINIDLKDKKQSQGIVGQAIKKQAHTISNDIKNDRLMSPWMEDALKNGYNSAAAFPLIVNGETVGAFALYANEVNFFDEDEINLLDELTMDISFALESKQQEVEVKRAEEELRKKEDQMRLLVEGTPYLFFYTQNANAELTYISPSVEKITGHPVDQWYNQRHWFITNNPINKIAKENTYTHLRGEFTKNSSFLEVKHADNHPILLEIFENPIISNGKVVGLQGVAHNITKQKRIEEKLKESEELFRNLVENITDVFYIVDGQGKIKYCSPNFFTITGFAQEEIVGHLYLRVIAPIDRRLAIEHYAMETEKGTIDTNLELRVKKKDGTIRWVEQNTRIVRDENGNVFEYRNVARNINERKLTEDALRESEATFRRLFEESADSILLLDDTGFFACNQATITLLGYSSKEEFLNKQPWEVSPERQPDGMLSNEKAALMIAKALQQGYNRFEWVHVKADGTEFPVDVLLTPVAMKGKQVFHTIWRDITERKKVEDALRVSEERFRIISHLTSDYIFSTKITDDGKAEMDWVMGAFENITGYTLEEYKAIGGWNTVLYPDDREKDFHDYEKLLNNEKVISEVRTIQKNGNIVWVRSYAQPVWDEKANKLIGIYGAAEDVTERKQTEELLRESEERYRMLVNLSPDAIGVYLEGKIVYVNDAAVLLLGGKNKEELIGRSVIDFVHPEDKSMVIERSKALLTGKLVPTVEEKFIQLDGTVIDVEVAAMPLAYNNRPAVQLVIRDITKRKLAENALRKSELHFRSIWENSASGMRLTNEDGIIVAVNTSFCSLVGKTKQELEGAPLSIIYKTQDRLNIQNKHRERFEKRTVKKLVENEFILWDGKKIWLRVANSFIESEYEKPLLLGIFTEITEQKLAEREIRKLSQAVEQSAGAIVITDLKGNIEYVNKKFEEVTGYTFAEVKGQNPRILKSGETPDEEYKEMWNTILAENEWRGTFHNKRKDGSLYWEATTISAIKNNEGRITNFLAIKDDITQDKLKEELLKKSELHFRSIWESSLDGMRLTDENGIIVSVNDAFAKLFEKEKSEIIGKSFAVVYGKDSGFNDVASFVHRFADRTIQPFMERDITLWNDKPMSVELTNSFVEVEGQPPLLLSIFKNATEKKQSEQKIQLLAHSIESIGECVSITEINNRVLFVNDAFIKTYGYSREELIGNDISIIRPERDARENLQQIFSSTLNGGWKGEVVNRRKDGTTFPVYLSTSVIKDNEGNPLALIGVASDITDTKKSREELILAKEKAEEANKVKTNFLENMSHELRTPMISILGFTELMKEMELPDEVKDMATMMNKSGNRLMDTLNIILDLAQIEKERVIVKPAEVNILTIIDEVCDLLQPMAKERNLYLKKEFPADSLTITTDGRMLRHMLNNLINNGLKFTPKGGVTITATVAKEGDGNFAIIKIRDTGIGIPKDQQEIIWEEFRQASEGIGRSFEGNGLGLTITKSFIEKLNGKILLESEVGVGTTFTIKLPIDNNSTTVKEILVKEEISVEKQIVTGEPLKSAQLRKVLYVEDEEISFSVVKHFLKGIVLLDWAKSGQEGVVMARGNKYDAILMDINLARGIDGMQTTKLVRALPEYQQTPIIAITAYAMRGDKEEFLSVGCSHYISKPFSRTALLNLMEDVFKEK